MKFDWWNTIQAREKFPYVNVVHWLGMLWLNFGRCLHGTWWNVSCLACAFWVKEKKFKANLCVQPPDSMTYERKKHLNTVIGLRWLNAVICLARDTYPNAAIWVVQDTYSNAAIWCVRDTYPNATIWLARDTYPNAAIWCVRDTYHYAAIWLSRDTYPNAANWWVRDTYPNAAI